MKDFEFIEHTADIKIRVYGATLAELFRNALIGMFQAIKPKAKDCTYEDDRLVCPHLPNKREVVIHSLDREALLVDFLSYAWYLCDVHNEAYLDAIINSITDTDINATLLGVSIQGFDVVEIKAVTYHDLALVKNGQGIWQTDIIFDI